MGGNIVDAAFDYADRGIQVVPLHVVVDGRCTCPKGTKYGHPGKHPVSNGWTSEELTGVELRANLEGIPRNIGAKLGAPSGGLIDVDKDCAEARVVAPTFLPETGWRFGRASAPGSHSLYVADPLPAGGHYRFTDVDGTVLVELRSTGHQTVLPPSVHRSGEGVEWERFSEPARVRGEALLRSVRELATAALIARHLPAGGRHDFGLALMGYLLRPGRLGKDTVLRIARAAWDCARYPEGKNQDEAHGDLEAIVESTVERLEEGGEATGGRALDGYAEGLTRQIARYWGWEKKRGSKKDEEEEGETQAQGLVRLAEPADLFHDPDGTPYATFPVGNHRETHPVRTKGFKGWLRHRFYREQAKPPGAQAVQDAVELLAYKAEYEGREREVHVRIAGHEDNIYLDLCNQDWEAVEITPDGWRVIPASEAPVRFRKPGGMFPLSRPERGGSLEPLYGLLNLTDEESRVLITAWLVAAFRPSGPYPALILQGEQGSAKSTAARILRQLVDPNKSPLRETPRDTRDLAIAAGNGWVIAYDNLSYLPGWLSDALCRVATGGGFATRALYTDDEEKLFDFMRPICLNDITDVATRPDLLDRALLVELPTIPRKKRRLERSIKAEIERWRPQILGALLDAASAALRNLDEVELEEQPRLADFAEWVTAAEEGLGWQPGLFMEKYAGAMAENQERALAGDPVAEAVLLHMGARREWAGTPTMHHNVLLSQVSEAAVRSKAWPKTPQHLTARLKRLAPALREQGLSYKNYHDEDRAKTRKRRVFWEEGYGPSEEEVRAADEERGSGDRFQIPS